MTKRIFFLALAAVAFVAVGIFRLAAVTKNPALVLSLRPAIVQTTNVFIQFQPDAGNATYFWRTNGTNWLVSGQMQDTVFWAGVVGRIQWPTESNKVYVLQTCPSLTSPVWTDIRVNILGNGRTQSWYIDFTNRAFFRVKTL